MRCDAMRCDAMQCNAMQCTVHILYFYLFLYILGVQVNGWFIVTIWGWFTFKSAYFLAYHSKKYHQGLIDATGDILSVDPLVYDT